MAPNLSEEDRLLYKESAECWVENEAEGWVLATVKHIDDDDKIVLNVPDHGEKKVKEKPPLKNNPEQWTVQDMANLSFLHEPAVLQTLQVRFFEDNIYTYSGIVLISVNPFKRITELYNDEVIQAYRGQQMGHLDPHLYAVAEEAFQCLARDSQSQSIIVSGESGAGKTVSAKFIMRYLAAVGGTDSSSGKGNVEEQIMASNPILEAIGNAKTTRNDNSSRFGKFMQLQMSKDFSITGAVIRTYLLEKSRVVTHSPQERNYHVFYQLIAGTPAELKEKWNLGAVADYRYTNQGVETVGDVDDVKEYNDVVEAMSIIGIPLEIQHSLWESLVGILNLGNINCADKGVPATDQFLIESAERLDVDLKELNKWINKRKITAGRDVMLKPNTKSEMFDALDALGKTIYSRMFDWLVEKINDSVMSKDVDPLFIGILDIYGFESFDRNSFEQFCINYANENLQQQFNSHVFRKEQEDYVKEGIEWSFIGFSDNKPCLELIEEKIGILALLDEECVMTKGSDENLCEKLCTNFKNHEFFAKPKLSGKRALFTVKHYAHPVTYDTEGFLEKNKDRIANELLEVLRNSKNEYLQMLFPPPPKVEESAGGRQGKRKVATVGSQFKTSLKVLMATLYTTNTHYVRCLKPNLAKKAGLFSRDHILEQLRACGVLSTIKISQAGYPGKMEYEGFVDRYRLLATDFNGDEQTICKNIITSELADGKFQFGSTKLFLRAGQQALLEAKRSEVLARAVIRMQAQVRGYIRRVDYQRLYKANIKIQTFVRCINATRFVESVRRETACKRIQTCYRGYIARKHYARLLAAIRIQTCVRAYFARQQYARMVLQKNAATKIQAQYRKFVVVKDYLRVYALVIRIQARCRRRIAFKKFKIMKAEARDMGNKMNAAIEKAFTMEKKVLELSMKLETQSAEFAAKEKEFTATMESLQRKNTQGSSNAGDLHDRILQLTEELSKSKELANSKDAELQKAQNTVSELERKIYRLESEQIEASALPTKSKRSSISQGAGLSRGGSLRAPPTGSSFGRRQSESEQEDDFAPAASNIKRSVSQKHYRKPNKRRSLSNTSQINLIAEEENVVLKAPISPSKSNKHVSFTPEVAAESKTSASSISSSSQEEVDAAAAMTGLLKRANQDLQKENKKLQKQLDRSERRAAAAAAAAATAGGVAVAAATAPATATETSSSNTMPAAPVEPTVIDNTDYEQIEKLQKTIQRLEGEIATLEQEILLASVSTGSGGDTEEKVKKLVEENIRLKKSSEKLALEKELLEMEQKKLQTKISAQQKMPSNNVRRGSALNAPHRPSNMALNTIIGSVYSDTEGFDDDDSDSASEGEMGEDEYSLTENRTSTQQDDYFHMFEFQRSDLSSLIGFITTGITPKISNGRPLAAYLMSRCLRYTIYFNKVEERQILEEEFMSKIYEQMIQSTSTDLNLPAFWTTNTLFLAGSLVGEQNTVKLVTEKFKTNVEKAIIFSYRQLLRTLERRLEPFINVLLETRQQQRGFLSRLMKYTVSDLLIELSNILKYVDNNGLPNVFIQGVFSYISSYIGFNMLSRLIIRHDLCTWNRGRSIAANLQQIKGWYLANNIHDESLIGFDSIYQGLGLLIHANKLPKNIPDVSKLTLLQIRKILTNYHGDYGEKIKPDAVATVIKQTSDVQNYVAVQPSADKTELPEFSLGHFCLSKVPITQAAEQHVTYLKEMTL